MAKLSILAGATSQTVNVFIQNSSSTTGAGLTGLVYNSTSLTAYYVLPRAASAAITLVTLASASAAWSSGGFVEIDSTHCPGLYRVDIPNAALASGRFVIIYLQGATNMAPCVLEIELTGWDNQDAVHGGMSALPNTACTTNASLLTSGTGTDQVSVSGGRAKGDVSYWNGTVVSAPATAGIPDVNVKNYNNVVAATDANNLPKVDVEDWKAAAAPANTGDAYARLGAPAGASVSADIAAVKSDTGGIKTQTDKIGFTGTSPYYVQSDVVDWKGAAAPAMTGDAYARLGAPVGASVSADVAALKTDLDAGVKVSVGTGAGQINASGGKVPATVAAADVSGNPNVTVNAYAAGLDPATEILATPANKLATDVSGGAKVSIGTGTGQINASGGKVPATVAAADVSGNPNVTVNAYATGLDPATEVLATPANKLTTDATGRVTVGSNADKTGYALTAAYDAAKTAAQAGNQMDLVSAPNATAITAIQAGLATSASIAALPTATQNADGLLKRDMSVITGEAARSPLNALRAIRNKATIALGTLTVTKEDDTTTAWTGAVSTDPAAQPIVGIDPA